MSNDRSDPAEQLCLSVMAAMAGVAVELTGSGGLLRDWALPWGAALAARLMATATRRRPARWRRDSSVAAACGAAAGLGTHAFEPGGVTAALDVLLLGAAAGVLPALLAWSWERRVRRLVALLSAFVVVVETSFSGQNTTQLVVLLYALAAAAWLTRVSGAAAVSWRAATAAAMTCVVIGGAVGLRVSGVPVARALSGFVPASGGTGDGSASARAGVGSGPDEVAGEQAASNGYDQTDRFSESAQDGLYDLFVEAYGQPMPNKPSDKMVGLKPKDTKVVAGNDRQDLRSGRLFELRRKSAPTVAAATRPAGDALLYVEGRTPLRLRLTSFDAYAGGVWQAASDRKVPASLRVIDREHWLSLIDRPDFSAAAAPERHRVKIAALPGDVLPTPPALLRFKLGRAGRPDFFRESRGGLLTLARTGIPGGAVLDTEAPTFDPDTRDAGELVTPRAGRWTDDAPLDVDERRLVEGWTAGVGPGWPQVDAVVAGVRARGRFVRGAASDAADPLRAFLIDGRPGDDAQFASAVALALRSLGYKTRLVAGLYAGPGAFDAETGQTPVGRTDVHLWPEIRLPTGAWLPLEPTPGYALLGPRPAFWATARAWLRKTLNAVVAHWPAVLAATVLAAATAVLRRRLVDAVDTLAWRVRRRETAAGQVRRTAALLDRRARRWRRGRPLHATRSTWLAGRRAPAAFCRMVDWAEYGASTTPPQTDARAVCRAAVRAVGRASFIPSETHA